MRERKSADRPPVRRQDQHLKGRRCVRSSRSVPPDVWRARGGRRAGDPAVRPGLRLLPAPTAQPSGRRHPGTTRRRPAPSRAAARRTIRLNEGRSSVMPRTGRSASTYRGQSPCRDRRQARPGGGRRPFTVEIETGTSRSSAFSPGGAGGFGIPDAMRTKDGRPTTSRRVGGSSHRVPGRPDSSVARWGDGGRIPPAGNR